MSKVTPELFIAWLKDKGLFSKVSSNYSSFIPVFEKMLKIRKRDEVLIISDLGEDGKRSAPLMAGCYMLACKRLGLKFKIALQKLKGHKEKADPSVVQALSNLQEDNFILLALSGKLGSLGLLGKSFRKYMKKQRQTFASTLNLSELPTIKFSYLVKSLSVDYRKLNSNATKIERMLTMGNQVNIITNKGTCLKIGIRGMKALKNDASFQGIGGNIPVGEVYIPPRNREVEGTVVIDGSLKTRKGTTILKKPISLFIKNGEIEKINGDERLVKDLKETIRWSQRNSTYAWGTRRIGELGIGINPNASIVGPTIINEKAKGTAHIAIGSNAWFGGSVYSIIHLDQVFRKPKIWVDGKRINLD